jgi:hypothetical protein
VPGAGAPQQPGPPQGYPQQPQAPYGAPPPGPGGGFPPPGQPPFGAPPTGGGGGGKKTGLILAIVGIVVLLIVGAVVLFVVVLGGDDDDDDKGSDPTQVTATVTQSTDATTPTEVTTTPTDVTTSPTDVTTSPTDTGGGPTEDPTITAQAYLDSLVEGNCLAVEGLSTPEWWQATFRTQQRCERQSEDSAEMSTAQYNSFEEPVDNGDGSVTVIADVTDSSDNTDYTVTWILVPSEDGTTWLVSAFNLV